MALCKNTYTLYAFWLFDWDVFANSHPYLVLKGKKLRQSSNKVGPSQSKSVTLNIINALLDQLENEIRIVQRPVYLFVLHGIAVLYK